MLDFKQIAALLAPLPGKTALLIKDREGTLYSSPLAGEEFKSASLIKLAVACYYQAHPQDLGQTVHIPEDKIVDGGMLCHLAQRDWQLRDVLDLMLSDSDNTATNFLIDFAGFAKMAAWFEEEFSHLHLGRYLMEETDRENYISAETALKLLERLLDDPTPFGRVCQKALFYQESVNKLLQNLPEGCSYSKTGELADTEHDAARIFVGENYYDICFMSRFAGLEERKAILLAQNAVGELAYRDLLEKNG
ncbi:hypothetical protein lacNasYZ03_13860 [Lactobacillus nasalidis]|uniref:Beta-lactamase class A catalytic domain-containing protein n=1 Tax=Lactobacillus nasalidis TaxID=2797258 RepID=A0ABQ3W7E6_9LACO|nr:serine hydrolase [Lactobacillus nasalidis]GHV97121.1 hypothetical protein lacNasYZ01_03030 [Lactobacillus nasalidis]GHV99565.1 hypothetical protein lacNasYZ02_09950 [Lactobacillus nasalidis]GHW01699.1 hypothetical protein lacNasYZ03_13860 [Lactobacillus nasalidis]